MITNAGVASFEMMYPEMPGLCLTCHKCSGCGASILQRANPCSPILSRSDFFAAPPKASMFCRVRRATSRRRLGHAIFRQRPAIYRNRALTFSLLSERPVERNRDEVRRMSGPCASSWGYTDRCRVSERAAKRGRANSAGAAHGSRRSRARESRADADRPSRCRSCLQRGA